MVLSGKRVLVTGSEGFIGSHLVAALVARGAKVRALVLYNPFNSWGWLHQLAPAMLADVEVVMSDVRDPHAMRRAASESEVIFHLAALISIPFSYESPFSYLETNTRGTLNVLEAAREAHCQKVLVTSTSEVYGTAERVPIDETHPLNAQSPYSASKIAGEKFSESFARSFGLPVTIVRPFNTYGPRQSARAVIPTVITQLLTGKREIHLGSTAPTRDFVFVEDTVEGFLRIAETDGTEGTPINIATGREISIGILARTLIDLIDPSARIATDDSRVRPATSEVERLLGDPSRLKRLCGWVPGTTLDEGLRRTVDWFRIEANLKHYRTDIYNI